MLFLVRIVTHWFLCIDIIAHHKATDHFYWNVLDVSRYEAMGFKYEGIAGYIYSTQVAGTVPLYRLWHSGVGDHHYTISENNKAYSITQGFADEGIVGYVYSTQVPGTSTFYRLWSEKGTDHFFTISWPEMQNAIRNLGYVDQGNEGYIFGSVPSECVTCTSFTYSAWSTCLNGQQTRTVVSSIPSGCAGGNPVLSQSCDMPVQNTTNQTNSTCFLNNTGNGICLFNGVSYVLSTAGCGAVNVTVAYSGITEKFFLDSFARLGNTGGDYKATLRNGVVLSLMGSPCAVYQYTFEFSLYNSSISSTATCTDSDGGLNYYVKGQTNSTDVDGLHVFTDFCRENNVVEGYCTGSIADGNEYSCPNGCVDGACVNVTTPKYNLTLTGVVVGDSVGDANLLLGHGELLVSNNIVGPVVFMYLSEVNFSDVLSNGIVLFVNDGKRYLVLKDSATVQESVFALDVMNVIIAHEPFNENETNTGVLVLHYSEFEKMFLNQSCQSRINQIKNPADIFNLANDYWLLRENYSIDGFGLIADYVSNNNERFQIIVPEIDSYYSDMINNQDSLCVKLDIENVSENVYSCVNIYDLAHRNQENRIDDVSRVMVIQKDGFSVIIEYRDMTDYSTIDWVSRNQQVVLNTLNKLIGGNYAIRDTIEHDVSWKNILNYLFASCNSTINRYYYMPWQCKFEPLICPPHGEQKQTCIRDGETKETIIQCSPGICSGCYVPRWFGASVLDNTCIPYGFRFMSEEGEMSTLDNEEVSENPGSYLNVSSDESAYLYLIDNNSILYDGFIYVGNYFTVSSNGVNYEFYVVKIDFKEQTVAIKIREKVNAYCDIDGQISQQKVSQGGEWAKCQNNYECYSNVCSNGECVDTAALATELAGFKGFLTRMLCKLSNLFNAEDYAQCLADNI